MQLFHMYGQGVVPYLRVPMTYSPSPFSQHDNENAVSYYLPNECKQYNDQGGCQGGNNNDDNGDDDE
jgi:hypothetical protein